MARKRRSRARQYGGGGGGFDLGALVDSFGSSPELTTGAKDFIANPQETAVPENIYDDPGFFSRVFFPTAAEAASEGNAAWDLSRLDDASGQSKATRAERQELADRLELSFIDSLDPNTISETNKARGAQLRDALAGKATTRLSNEGLANSNAAGRLTNEENQQTSSGRVNAANALTALNAALSASRGREIPSAERANVMQNNRRRIDLSRVPDPDSAVVRDIDEASGNLGATPYEGGNYTVAKDLEDFRYDRGVRQRDREQQAAREFEAGQAELNRAARSEENALDREARAVGKADPLAALLGGASPEGPRQLGGGFVAVPRPAGTTAPSAPVSSTVTTSARPREGQQALPLTSANLDQLRSETLPFSQRDTGFAGMANLLNPVSPNNIVNKVYGNKGMGFTGDTFVAPEDISKDNSLIYQGLKGLSAIRDVNEIKDQPWFNGLSSEEKVKLIQNIRANAVVNQQSQGRENFQ